MDNPLFDDGPIVLGTMRPDDVLSYLPYRFGYVPTDSLAVLAVLEPVPGEIVLGLAARLDLADIAQPGVLMEAMTRLREQLELDRTVWTFTVLYDEATVGDVRARRGRGARVLADWLAGFPFAEPSATFLVTSSSFRCLQCPHLRCCPPEGHRLERLSQTEISARMVLAGHALVPKREQLGCARDVSPERAADAAAAARRELVGMGARSPDRRHRWRARMLDVYGSSLIAAAGTTEAQRTWVLDPSIAGRLSAALTDPDLRDAVVAWSLGGERISPGSAAVMDAFGGLITGGLPVPPADHLNAAEQVLTEVVRHAAPGRAGHPLAVLGWLAWWRGEGARADVLLRQCLQEDPGNGLGRLLAEALDGGVRPGWALPDPTVAPGLR